MSIGKKTCRGIDAISETHVLGFFRKADFGCELYKSFAQSINSNMHTKKSNPNMANETLSGSEKNIDPEISAISIIISAFSKWLANLFNIIFSHSISCDLSMWKLKDKINHLLILQFLR